MDDTSVTKVWRLSSVADATGLRKSSIYNRISVTSKYYDPTFPKPFKLGPRAVGFLKSEVESWIDQKVTKRVG